MFSDDIYLSLQCVLPHHPMDQVFVLTDEQAAKHCLPVLRAQLRDFGEAFLAQLEHHTLILPAGETHKHLDTVCRIWDFLIEHGATRRAIVLNLGGGVVTDMCGFAASCYKRGIPFVNIPTTLLAIVDASEGGKTGIDYGGLKNEIGLFREAEKTVIYLPFLRTLPAEEFLSGWAEMIKHALIASPLELSRLMAFDIETCWRHPDDPELDEEFRAIVERSVDIKSYFVEQDPEEENQRRILNFGHTIGHAIEEQLIEVGTPRPHGYCVMWGMLAELYLSHIVMQMPTDTLSALTRYTIEHYGKITLSCQTYDRLIELMHHDKKNEGRTINFTLLRQVGNPFINRTATDDQIKEALDYLFSV